MDSEEVIIGIDLGTINSVVCVIRDGEVEIIPDGDQQLLPSVVGVDEKGATLVGTPARNQLSFRDGIGVPSYEPLRPWDTLRIRSLSIESE